MQQLPSDAILLLSPATGVNNLLTAAVVVVVAGTGESKQGSSHMNMHNWMDCQVGWWSQWPVNQKHHQCQFEFRPITPTLTMSLAFHDSHHSHHSR